MRAILTLLVAALPGVAQPASAPPALENYGHLGYVVVTPNGPLDGGDFGPHTPGTRTAGIQEAIDTALASVPQKNVWITGKQDVQTRANTYEAAETIYVPPSQGFTIESGLYVLMFTGSTSPAVWIDSAMNCKYYFGIIGSASKSAPTILIKPKNLLPIDTWASPVTTVLDFRIEAALGGSAAVAIDATEATIVGNTLYANEIASSGTGLVLVARSGRFILDNRIGVTRNHGSPIQAQVGDPLTPPDSIRANHLSVEMDSDGVPGAAGLILASGRNNVIKIVSSNGMQPGKGLILGPDASENLIEATSLASGMTNQARKPTNRLVTSWPVGFAVETPPVPHPGRYATNRNPYTVEVTITSAGRVNGWTVMDANGLTQTVAAGLTVGQQITLAPGDSLQFSYDVPPAWQWRAVP